MRSPSQPPVSGAGLGYYQGSPLPVDPVPTLLRNFLGSLKGPPGIRLSSSNDPSGRYFGTNLIPGILDTKSIPAAANTPDDLNQALITSDTYGPGVPI